MLSLVPMTFKEQLTQSMGREIALLKQLAPFIREEDLTFRPAEKVRSTYELMQYVSGIGATMLRWFIKNDLNPDEWVKIRAYRATLTRENFVERLEEQWLEIQTYMQGVSEEDFENREVELPNKEKMVLSAAILNAPLKWLTTYRMELFVYLKLNGHVELGTREAWTILA